MRVPFVRLIPTLLLLACSITACNSSQPPPDVEIPVHTVTSYLPYVVALEFPLEVHEGEPVDAVMKLSAALRPEILAGVGQPNDLGNYGNHRFLLGFHRLLTDQADGGFLIETWLTEDVPPGTPDSETVFNFGGFPAGTYIFRVSSADSEENGGLEGLVDISPWSDPHPHPHAIYKEYTLTVLPAELPGT